MMHKTAYVECDDTMAGRDLVEAIERSMGIPHTYGTIWKQVNGIREFLNTNPGYLLIIDEADKLLGKYSQKKMEILRAIIDQSTVGMVIAGEPRLESLLKSYLPRFSNRVDFYYSLKGLTKKELEQYLKDFSVDGSALNELYERAANVRTGCFRLLDRTLKNVLRSGAQKFRPLLSCARKRVKEVLLAFSKARNSASLASSHLSLFIL